MTTSFYQTPAGRLFAVEAGAGPPVICLHGITANAYVWLPVMERLAADYRVVAIDQRGHGRSDRPDSGYAAGDFAADVVALIEALGAPAVLIGHSLGARNALAAATAAPDAVEHLLENVYDEIFRPKGEGDHPGLWVQFALRLGATKEELVEVARRPLAEVIGFPRTMTYFCRRSAAEGLASWYADEAQLPEAHGATALALRKFYGLDDETIEYFLEHVRADLGHTDSSGHLIEDYIGSAKDIARARRASAVTLWAWCEMHEAILRELRRRHGF